jgi:hypothetical protein
VEFQKKDPWHLRSAKREHLQELRWLHLNYQESKIWQSDWSELIARENRLRNEDFPVHSLNPIKRLDELFEKDPTTAFQTAVGAKSQEIFLMELRKTVEQVRLWTLQVLKEKTLEKDQSALKSLLSTSSWNTGRNHSLTLWEDLPPEHRQNLKSLATTFQGSPKSPEFHFLPVRQTATEVECVLQNCPHRRLKTVPREWVDWLCELETQWAKGWIYALHPGAKVEVTLGNAPFEGYCVFRLGWESAQRHEGSSAGSPV